MSNYRLDWEPEFEVGQEVEEEGILGEKLLLAEEYSQRSWNSSLSESGNQALLSEKIPKNAERILQPLRTIFKRSDGR